MERPPGTISLPFSARVQHTFQRSLCKDIKFTVICNKSGRFCRSICRTLFERAVGFARHYHIEHLVEECRCELLDKVRGSSLSLHKT